MKTCYIDRETRTIADLVKPDVQAPGWTITRINVPQQHRGNKYGSAMLKRICADADIEGAALYLFVSPSGGLNFAQLTDWYKRYGFERILTGYMRRLPMHEAPIGRQLEAVMNEARALNQVCPNKDCQQPIGQPCRTRSRNERKTPHVKRYADYTSRHRWVD